MERGIGQFLCRLKAAVSLAEHLHERHERHETEKKRLKGLIQKWQAACPHAKSRYHADPAGDSSESYEECSDCGKTF